MNDNIANPTLPDELTYCARHPDRDTGLRCNRCERYMCIECAKRTPVGYTCRECVRGHENKFYAGTSLDYAIVAAVSLLGGGVIAFISGLVGGVLLLGLIIAPALGGVLAQLALQLSGRRRGRYSGYVCAGGVAIGGILTALLLTGLGVISLLYVALAASTAFARYKATI